MVFLFLVTLIPVQAQQAASWHDLITDFSTPEDATRILGSAKKDVANQKLVPASRRGSEWLSVDENDKVYRKMVFDKVEGFAEAKLYFRNNKLVAMELVPKSKSEAGWLDPDDLQSIFKLEFKPHNAVFGGKPLGTPTEFMSVGDPGTSKGLLAFYEMIAAGETSFIFAAVDNREPVNTSLIGGSSGRKDSKAKDARDRGGEFPGYVTSVQIFGKTLWK